MNYEITAVKQEEKEKLYKLLQYALYDGSQYIDNDINEDCIFEYRWFNNYFTDKNRHAYFIKNGNSYIGMVMVNENLKFNKSGKCIAEFLILPRFRRQHIGKKVAYEIFEKFKGDWEVQPMENNPIAYSFWKNIISEYTNGNYTTKNDGIEDVFIFNNKQRCLSMQIVDKYLDDVKDLLVELEKYIISIDIENIDFRRYK